MFLFIIFLMIVFHIYYNISVSPFRKSTLKHVNSNQELKQPADLPNHNQLKETPAMKKQDNDFNNMYQGINEQQISEPMAANDFFGGGFTSF